MAKTIKPDVDVGNLIDDYIERAEPFAQPILKKLRLLIHKAEPDIIEEWKWSSPVFSYKGLVCLTWSFKKHAAIHFYKGVLLPDPHGVLVQSPGGNVSSRSIKFRDASEIDPAVIVEYVKYAVQLNEDGVQVPVKKKKALEPPPVLVKALKENKLAGKSFKSMSPSHQREYIEYILEAKKEETRIRRVEKAISQLEKFAAKNLSR